MGPQLMMDFLLNAKGHETNVCAGHIAGKLQKCVMLDFLVVLFILSVSPIKGSTSNSVDSLENFKPGFQKHDGETVNIAIELTFANRSVYQPIRFTRDNLALQELLSNSPNLIRLFVGKRSQIIGTFHLESKSELIGRGDTIAHASHSEKLTASPQSINQPKKECFYTSRKIVDNKLIAFIDLCGGVNGTVKFGNKMYRLQPIVEEEQVKHQLVEINEEKDLVTFDIPRARHVRQVGPSKSIFTDFKYIETYVIVNNALFKQAGTVEEATSRVVNMVKEANALLKYVNVKVILVGVEVWDEGNKFEYRRDEITDLWHYALADEIFPFLRSYQNSTIRPKVHHDFLYFMIEDFTYSKNPSISKATTLCSTNESIYVGTYKPYDELGVRENRFVADICISFGLKYRIVYSEKRCWCTNFYSCAEGYGRSVDGLREMSNCTKMEMGWLINDAGFDCFDDEPRANETIDNGGTLCGNYIIEEGEDCDCGPKELCWTKCCNSTTCKFSIAASCATGDCCDLETCTMKPESTLCRPKDNDECDLEDRCDGISEFCPKNRVRPDGYPCYNMGEAFCYDGKCNSHESQCDVVWGGSADATKDKDACYEKNSVGDILGNCGWITIGEEGNFTREYLPCRRAMDNLCGLLHCKVNFTYRWFQSRQNQPALDYDYLEKSHAGRTNGTCLAIAFDFESRENDPGQVPNGAKCGEKMMCLNKRCTILQNDDARPPPTTTTTTTTMKPSTTVKTVAPTKPENKPANDENNFDDRASNLGASSAFTVLCSVELLVEAFILSISLYNF